ncbi:MAG TPA: class I SAM-dependent methyltransferase [Acidobacteriota bacterium]|jgi:SAM-dependent methyltransferase
MHSIDFDKEFVKGSAAFEGFLADWWLEKSNDPAHRRAYKNISSKMHQILSEAGISSPKLIVDYACGNGAILDSLGNRFPETNIIAIDGSKKMLSLAKSSLEQAGPQPLIEFLHSPLPNFSLPEEIADVVLFLFPNITINSKERRLVRKQLHMDVLTLKTAKFLAKWNEIDCDFSADECLEDILDSRAITSNIHRILNKGGFWFHVEYANAPRNQWDEIDKITTLFEESAWPVSVETDEIRREFRLIKSLYFRSSVMLDVYEQSGDPEDRDGGYVISVLQAL